MYSLFMSKFTEGLKTSAKHGAAGGFVMGALLTGGNPIGTGLATVAGAAGNAVKHYLTYDAKSSQKHPALGKQFK